MTYKFLHRYFRTRILFSFLLFLFYFQSYALAYQMGEEATNSIGMKFKKINPGKFRMGRKEPAATLFEKIFWKPRFYDWEHEVALTKEFYIAVYEFTYEDYKKLFQKDFITTDKRLSQNYIGDPKSAISHFDPDSVEAVIKFLNEKEKELGRNYRLPTEAEWEYSCRAGTRGRYFFGEDEKMLSEYAWFDENSGRNGKKKVGLLKPNPWGLYDILGNAEEWTNDKFGEYPKNGVTDPGRSKDLKQIGEGNSFRGGSSWSSWNDCCSFSRRSVDGVDGHFAIFSNQGLRLVFEK